MVDGVPVLDLDYAEDSRLRHRHERGDDRRSAASSRSRAPPRATPFSRAEMDALVALAEQGIEHLIAAQMQALGALPK